MEFYNEFIFVNCEQIRFKKDGVEKCFYKLTLKNNNNIFVFNFKENVNLELGDKICCKFLITQKLYENRYISNISLVEVDY